MEWRFLAGLTRNAAAPNAARSGFITIPSTRSFVPPAIYGWRLFAATHPASIAGGGQSIQCGRSLGEGWATRHFSSISQLSISFPTYRLASRRCPIWFVLLIKRQPALVTLELFFR